MCVGLQRRRRTNQKVHLLVRIGVVNVEVCSAQEHQTSWLPIIYYTVRHYITTASPLVHSGCRIVHQHFQSMDPQQGQ